MSIGYGWEGLRQVRATLLGARHVPERLCGGPCLQRGAITSVRPLPFYLLLSGTATKTRHNPVKVSETKDLLTVTLYKFFERDLHEFLWLLFDETFTVDAPPGALQVQAMNEVSERILAVHQLVCRGEVRHTREQGGLVQRPTVATTRGLNYGRQVGFGNV